MTKKINPKNQTEELNRTKIERLKRNPDELKKILKLIEKNEKGLDEYATRMATFSGECNQKMKESWKFFLSEAFFDKDYKAKVLEISTFPAANAGHYQAGFMAYIHSQIMVYGIENLHYMTKDVTTGQYFMTKDAMNEQFLNYLCKHARDIFTELTSAQPGKYLLVGIDLLRTKKVILAEVSELITRYQDMTGTEFEGVPQKRFKWLPNADDFMMVWDMREEGKSFSEIKESLSITTIDSAKKRFYRAFLLITGEEYDKNIWKELMRSHLERIAIDKKPTDKGFWNRVLKMETVSQRDVIPKNIKEDGSETNFIESVGQEGKYELKTVIVDLKNICFSCPDVSCRTETVKCLTEFEAGDEKAFEDFQPDCPKIYKYLKV